MMAKPKTIECPNCGKSCEVMEAYPTVAIQVWPVEKKIEAPKIEYGHCTDCNLDLYGPEALKIMGKKIQEIGGESC